MLQRFVQGKTEAVAAFGGGGGEVRRNGRAGLLAEALDKGRTEDITDEASAIELAGMKPRLVEGDAQNFKVTYPRDLALARAILASRKE